MHKHTFWDHDLWDQRGSKRWGLRQIKPEMHSLQKLMRQAFYHGTRSGILKAAVNVCLHHTVYWLNQLPNGADSGDLDWGLTQPQRRHVCFCECRSRGEKICTEPGLAHWLKGPLRKVFWHELHTAWICIQSSTWLWVCVWLSVFVDVFSNDVKYLLSRSCSGFKMFRKVFLLLGEGKKVLWQNPRIRRHTFPGTSRQLIYPRRDESSGVYSELPLCMCFCVCIKDRKCVGILYPCVYVKLLQMLRLCAVLLVVSSTQGLLSKVNAFQPCSL